jgi:hypothetical protein
MEVTCEGVVGKQGFLRLLGRAIFSTFGFSQVTFRFVVLIGRR